MKTGTLTKALIVIAAVLAVSIIGAVVVGQLQKGKDPVQTDDKGNQTQNIPQSSTDEESKGQETDSGGSGSNTAPNPSSSSDKTVNPPVTDSGKENSKTAAPTTDPPVTSPSQKAPTNFKYNKTINSNTGAYINTKAVITGTRNDDGTVHLKVVLYLVHYSIQTGGCANSYIKIGDNISVFTAPAIQLDKEVKTETLLATFEVDVLYGQTLSFESLYNFNGTYGKDKSGQPIKISGVKSEATLTIK